MFGFTIWKVKGQSMAPKVPNASYILANNWLNTLFIRAGQTLLLRHKEFGLIVKTVAVVDHNGLIWSKGENEHSVSVEQIGPLSTNDIVGRVVYVFRKP